MHLSREKSQVFRIFSIRDIFLRGVRNVRVGIAVGKNKFAALVRIAERGGIVTIMRHGHAVAELRPLLHPEPRRQEIEPLEDLFGDREPI
jgi:antitoxin (DNA-binding transcriptional repressor) of toxin-antitoxin stability system